MLAFSDRAAQSQPYNGPLLVRYPFRAEALPRNCSLVLEQPEMYASIRVNGRELRFGQGEETPGKNTGTTSKKTPGDVSDGEPAGFYLDRAFRTAEITPLLKKEITRLCWPLISGALCPAATMPMNGTVPK